MRLISQNGNFDIPYDEIVVEIFDKCVVGRLKEYIGRDIILGSYSTEEKAKKAMEMLREKYAHMKRVECMSASLASCEVSTLSNKDAKLLGNEVQKLMCFQFPKDEDVEV